MSKRKRQYNDQDQKTRKRPAIDTKHQFYRSALAALDVLRFDKVDPGNSKYNLTLQSCCTQCKDHFRATYAKYDRGLDWETERAECKEIFIELIEQLLEQYCGGKTRNLLDVLIYGLTQRSTHGRFKEFVLYFSDLLPLIGKIRALLSRDDEKYAYWRGVLELINLSQSGEIQYADKYLGPGQVMEKFIMTYGDISKVPESEGRVLHMWLIKIAPFNTLQLLVQTGFRFVDYHIQYAFYNEDFDKFDLVVNNNTSDNWIADPVANYLSFILKLKAQGSSHRSPIQDHHVLRMFQYAVRNASKKPIALPYHLNCLDNDVLNHLGGLFVPTSDALSDRIVTLEYKLPPLLDWIAGLIILVSTHVERATFHPFAPEKPLPDYEKRDIAARSWLMIGMSRHLLTVVNDTLTHFNRSINLKVVDYCIGWSTCVFEY